MSSVKFCEINSKINLKINLKMEKQNKKQNTKHQSEIIIVNSEKARKA